MKEKSYTLSRTSKTDEAKFPEVSKALLERLESLYPDKCPEQSEPLDQIRFKTGQVSVIRFLRAEYDLQNQKQITKDS